MQKRPISVTVVSLVFMAAGLAGIAYHAAELRSPRQAEAFWVLLVRLLAVAGAVFALRGRNWARWLLVAWMAFHVVLSLFHPPLQLLVHGLLLIAISYFLFNRTASAFFGQRRGAAPPLPDHPS